MDFSSPAQHSGVLHFDDIQCCNDECPVGLVGLSAASVGTPYERTAMGLGAYKRFCYYSALVLSWICIGGLAIVSGIEVLDLATLDSGKWGSTILEGMTWLQDWSPLIIPIFGASVALGQGCCYLIGPPWVWEALRAILNKFRGYAFSDDTAGDPLHYHRVTLFKHVRWIWFMPKYSWRGRILPWGQGRWPWSGWLVPVARSGHTSKSRGAVFLAPDDADHAEGIAGQTWATNSRLTIEELPHVEANPDGRDIATYASKTFVPEEWIRMRIGKKPFPRSLHGIPVEVNGRVWGVLVLDSRSNKGVKMRRAGSLVGIVGVVLDKLLERVK